MGERSYVCYVPTPIPSYPTQAGNQLNRLHSWIPACAGMTEWGVNYLMPTDFEGGAEQLKFVGDAFDWQTLALPPVALLSHKLFGAVQRLHSQSEGPSASRCGLRSNTHSKNASSHCRMRNSFCK